MQKYEKEILKIGKMKIISDVEQLVLLDRFDF